MGSAPTWGTPALRDQACSGDGREKVSAQQRNHHCVMCRAVFTFSLPQIGLTQLSCCPIFFCRGNQKLCVIQCVRKFGCGGLNELCSFYALRSRQAAHQWRQDLAESGREPHASQGRGSEGGCAWHTRHGDKGQFRTSGTAERGSLQRGFAWRDVESSVFASYHVS